MKFQPQIKKISLAALIVVLGSTAAHAESGTAFKELLQNPLAWGFGGAVLLFLIAVMALNKALNTVKALTLKQAQLTSAKAGEPVAEPAEEKSILSALTDAKPVEKEAEILLDHDYDGIHELDNNLPPWWVWGFYITIAWGVVYFILFHITGTAPHSAEEYELEMAAAEEAIEAYKATATNLVDETNVTILTDGSAISAGEKIFTTNCATCHAADGGGLAGPNLTDEYWLHGGGIKDIFGTIKNGVNGTAMIAWKDMMGAGDIQKVASYILTLQGTTPANPLPPQGEKWVGEEEGADPETPVEENTEEAADNAEPNMEETPAEE